MHTFSYNMSIICSFSSHLSSPCIVPGLIILCSWHAGSPGEEVHQEL